MARACRTGPITPILASGHALTHAGIRFLCAAFLGLLALAGVRERAWEPGSGPAARATAEAGTARPPASLSPTRHPRRQVFGDVRAALHGTARGTGSLLHRLPAPDTGPDRPGFSPGFPAPPRPISPVGQAAAPGIARFLTAARDGTLSFRSTGIPPPAA